MNNLNFKQKIIIGIMAIILIVFGIIFTIINNKKNSEYSIQNIDNNTNILNDNISENNITEDNCEDNYIYVHIIGEVLNTGIIKLKERR